ncbi:hypothetical protein [Cylindrospermopsis raciborskii]|uniref:hypothetical protein n=1 Tax=Cylindrospermopsis raciborskii TaxID=77022 RepID=UPI001FC9FE0E|nr:hypothetical protein [Cylindrospermopsis raciborskii]
MILIAHRLSEYAGKMRSHFSVGSGTGLSRRRSVIRQLTRRLGSCRSDGWDRSGNCQYLN